MARLGAKMKSVMKIGRKYKDEFANQRGKMLHLSANLSHCAMPFPPLQGRQSKLLLEHLSEVTRVVEPRIESHCGNAHIRLLQQRLGLIQANGADEFVGRQTSQSYQFAMYLGVAHCQRAAEFFDVKLKIIYMRFDNLPGFRHESVFDGTYWGSIF